MQPVDSTSREDIIMAGKYTVLFYVSHEVYKMSVMKESGQKLNLEEFITLPPIRGCKVGDWYLVDNIKCVEDIIYYAKSGDVSGATYKLVNE